MKRLFLSGGGCLLVAALFCALLTPCAAMAQPDVMTPELYAQLRAVHDVAISPDGNLIAYTLVVPRNPFVEEDGKAHYHLYTVDRNGQSRAWVTGEVRATDPAFTPDGRYISYLAERDEDDHDALYVIPVAGGESRKVIEFATEITAYAWAPNSREVAFLAKDSLPDEIEKLEDMGFDQEIYEEDWQPVRIWVLDTDDSAAAPRRLEIDGSARELHWSPEGAYLATTIAPTPLVDDRYMFRKVTIVDPYTGTVVRQYDTEGKLGDLAFSPDGQHLAFVAGVDINDPKEGELWLVSVDSDEITKLVTDFDGHVARVGWKDNETVMFLADVHVHTGLGRVKTDGSDMTMKRFDDGPVFRYLKIAADGNTMVLRGSDYNYPPEVFVAPTADEEPAPKRLTVTNPELLDIRFARQEVVNFTARDGLELEGILIYPLDYDESRRYPVVMTVHGGPESHVRDNWVTGYSYPGQSAAARGMAVFYPNYRGSTGRGVEFSKMGQADYAGGEFDDLVDAIDHLVEMGLADRDRIGITGRSYGGYATAWAATALTEHFACGVMGVGVSDLISKFGTTDIPMEMYHVHARMWPWDDWQFFLDRSPIYHADNSQTPLLIMHGEDDTRVHPSQSMELYRYLKTHGNAPVRLIFYQDEPHGTNKAAARYDVSRRILRWLEHYLLGPGGEPPDYRLDYSPLKPAEN